MDLILSWLNDEVQLSQKVNSIETQFSNGFLLGELLWKHNQQLNFVEEFIDKHSKQNKIHNFCLLEPTMKNLRVRFNSNVAKEIIDSEPTIALNVLHQLKNALDKVNNQVDVKVYKSTKKLNHTNPLMKIPMNKEKFDPLESKLFRERLNRILVPQTSLNLQNHQERFPAFKLQQAKKIERARKRAEAEMQAARDTNRNIELDKMRRVISFAENWKQKNDKNWRKNIAKQKAREKNDKAFRIKQTRRTEEIKASKLYREKHHMYSQIDAFEKINAADRDTEAETGSEELLYGEGGYNQSDYGMPVLEGQMFSIEKHVKRPGIAFVVKEREKLLHSEHEKKERDKRRRKMIVDQSKAQKEFEIQRKEAMLLQKLVQESKQEEEIRYEMWRAKNCKNAILENRALRDRQYAVKDEDIVEREQTREEDMLRQKGEELEIMKGVYLGREEHLNIQETVNDRDVKFQRCSTLVDILVQMTESCYQHLQDANSSEISPNFWNEALQLFKGQKTPFEHRSLRSKDSVVAYEKELPEDDKYSVFLKSELREYINSQGQWSLDHTVLKQESQDQQQQQKSSKDDQDGEEEVLAIPAQPVHNNILGDVIMKLIDINYPEEKEEVETEYPNYLPMKFAIQGKGCSGRHIITSFLNNKYGLEVIDLKKLVDYGLNRYGDCDDSFDDEEVEDQPLGDSLRMNVTGSDLLPGGYGEDGKNWTNQNLEEEMKIPSESQQLEEGLGEEGLERVEDVSEVQELDQEQQENSNESGEKDPIKPSSGEQKQSDKSHPEKSSQGKDSDNSNNNQGDEEALLSTPPLSPNDSSNGKNLDGQEEQVVTPPPKKKNPLKSLIRRIYSGEEPSDELYCQIIIDHLVKLFPGLSEDQYFQSCSQIKSKKIEKIKFELRDPEQPSQNQFTVFNKPPTQEAWRQIEVDEDQVPLVCPQGFVILDFPNSYNQALILEKMMTNFTPIDKITPSENKQKKKQLLALITPSAVEVKKSKLLPSGLDALFYLEVEEEKCLTRAFGNLKLPNTDTHYHLAFNPPPTDQSPLVEALELNVDGSKNPYTLIDSNKNHSKDICPVLNFYENFGDEKRQKLTLTPTDSNQEMTNLLSDVDDRVQEVLAYKNEYYKQLGQQAEQAALQTAQQAEEEQKKQEEEAKMEEVSKEVLEARMTAWKEQAAEDALNPELRVALLQIWEKCFTEYCSTICGAFESIRKQREMVSSRLAGYERAFIQFLERKDQKRSLVLAYQSRYNTFVEEFPDLLEEDNAKEELHQRVDDLCKELFEIALQKKSEASAERVKIKENGFTENELEIFASTILNMVQAELNRFYYLTSLLKQYFNALQRKPVNITSAPLLLIEGVTQSAEADLPPVEEKDEETKEVRYPRTETMIEKAIELVRAGEKKLEEETKQSKAPAGRGGRGKRGGKGAQKKEKVEDKEEEEQKSPLQIQMEEAIKKEQMSTLHRLQNLRVFSGLFMQGIRTRTDTMYENMENWLEYAFRTENDALDDLTSIFGRHIEQEKKIQEEVDVTNFDIIISDKVLNFFTPPPIIAPAIETQHESRFLISNLIKLKDSLDNLGDLTGFIDTKEIFNLFIRLINSEEGRQILPQRWASLETQQVETLVKKLDYNNEGRVKSNKIFSLIALEASRIPSYTEIENYSKSLEEINMGSEDQGTLDEATFVQIPAWFDESEKELKVYEQSNVYERLRFFKRLLFNANKNKEGKLVIERYILTIGTFDEEDGEDYFQALVPKGVFEEQRQDQRARYKY